jgi:hydroxyacylglutathione hydrolase
MLNITPIDAFQDNYIWLVRNPNGQKALVVDPGEARPVLQALENENLTLAALFITHHHADHTGGIRQLLTQYPTVKIFGPATERIFGLTHPVKEGDNITVSGIDAQFQVFDVSGHTAGHVAYYGENALFCGDTLFSVGCGRLFEGTPAQMHASLSKIAALPDETQVFCAHEYTLDNIAFAKWVEPNNSVLLQREAEVHALHDQDKPTVPSNLSIERLINPFLRFAEPSVIQAAETFAGRSLTTEAEVFATIRHWKDSQFD